MCLVVKRGIWYQVLLSEFLFSWDHDFSNTDLLASFWMLLNRCLIFVVCVLVSLISSFPSFLFWENISVCYKLVHHYTGMKIYLFLISWKQFNMIFSPLFITVQFIFSLLYQNHALNFSSLLRAWAGPSNCITHTPLLSGFLLGLESGEHQQGGLKHSFPFFMESILNLWPQVLWGGCSYIGLASIGLECYLPLSCTLGLRVGDGVSCYCLKLGV